MHSYISLCLHKIKTVFDARDIHMISVFIVLVERIYALRREQMALSAVFHSARDWWSFDKMVNSFQFCD